LTIENQLREFVEVLNRPLQEGIFFRLTNPLPESERVSFLHRVNEAFERLKYLKDCFDLTVQQSDLRNLISTSLLFYSIDLDETKTKHLLGYGPIPVETGELLDSELEAIQALVFQMQKICCGYGETPSSEFGP
jgi:hypothetical protein